MALTLDQEYLPATLTVAPMTDEQFAEFCSLHPDLSFEATPEGEIIVRAANYSLGSFQNGGIVFQLEAWNRKCGRRGFTSESSGLFVLPSGARMAPDASWTSRENSLTIDPESRERFWHLCPDFVIELKSPTDRMRKLRARMNDWIANGAQLAWMIDAEARIVEIYRPGREPEWLRAPDSVAGEGPVEGFVLDLKEIWDPLAT